MRHSRRYEICTDPLSGMDEAFHHADYALFRTDARMGRVVAARSPDHKLFGVGSVLQNRLRFSEEAVTYMVRTDGAPPLFILTEAGLGMLSKRYDLQMGLGLFLHVHCRPDIGARLLCEGALGEANTAFLLSRRVRELGSIRPNRRFRAKEEASYAALADAWGALNTFGREPLSVDRDHWLPFADLRDTVERMAVFAGCGLELLPPEGETPYRVRCYRPAVAEAVLLYILSEVRELSETRSATCRIGSVLYHDGPRLSIKFRFRFEEHSRSLRACTELSDARRYLSRVAGMSGLRVQFPGICLSAEERRLYRRLGSPDYGVSLEWCDDPFSAASGTLRAYLPNLRGLDLSSDDDWL